MPEEVKLNDVKSKIRKTEMVQKLKKDKRKAKKKRQEERKKVAEAMGDEAPPKLVPKTIESMREADETTVEIPASIKTENGEAADEAAKDDEVLWDIENDEFKAYFDKTYTPKVE